MASIKVVDRDLTQGNLHRNIWYLAVPMILETGIQNIAQLLDTYWVGRLGSAALAAVPLISIFDPTPQVVEIGSLAFRIVAPTLVASTLGVVLGRGFDGAGDTVPAMAINLFTLWGIEAALAFVLSRHTSLGLTGIWWARAIANVANGFLFALWFRTGRWKRRKV